MASTFPNNLVLFLFKIITGYNLILWLQISSILGNVIPLTSSNFSINDYEDDEYSKTPLKILKQSPPNPDIQTGVGCGYYKMAPNTKIQIQSSNFGFDTYNNNDACIWHFTGDNCLLAAKCPCFDVPASFQCLGDNLKISDSVLYSQRFCGEVAPQGAYRSVSGHLRIRFRTDFGGYAGRGFLCYVFCTEPGLADPVLPFVVNPATCFNGSTTASTVVPPSTTLGVGEVTITPPFSPLPPECETPPPIPGPVPGIIPIGEPIDCPPGYRRKING